MYDGGDFLAEGGVIKVLGFSIHFIKKALAFFIKHSNGRNNLGENVLCLDLG